MSRLPERLVLLAVQADEAAHAPVRAALKGIEGTRYEIHWVTTPRAALAALEEHPHDAFLVDRDLREPGHSGLDVARDILAHTPYAPVILLDDQADRETDLAASVLGVSDYLVHPSPATLERSLRYAVTHQRALRRLAESEERHALALQGANDGLWDWDVRADKLYFSPRWKAMIGYPEAEIGDAPGEWLGRVHPDDRAGLTQALEGHLSGATQHFESEHRIQHRDGSYRWMLARGIAVRDPNGRATRVVGSQTDVTDRRQAEQRLQHDALHDALTGLPNRVLFLDRLALAIRRAQRRSPEACAPCCSWTSTASSSSTTSSATTSATGCWSPSRAGWSGPAPRRHRRAARRRRVHDPARRRLRRARGDRGRRAHPGDAAGRSTSTATSWSPRPPSASRSPTPTPRRGRDARRRHGDVPRQVRGQGPPRRLRRAHARARERRLDLETDLRGAIESDQIVVATSRWCRWRQAGSSGSRRSCAGTAPTAGRSTRRTSSRSPRRRA